MKSEKGSITLYVSIACLFIIIVGICAYVGTASRQASQLAALKKIEEEYSNPNTTAEELYQQYDGGDIVPIFTPEQFAMVGSGEDVYVAETGKFYTFSIDKTYMFYGIPEDLNILLSQLKEDIKQEISVQIEEEKDVELEAATVEEPVLMDGMTAVYWSTDGGATASKRQEGAEPIFEKIGGKSTGATNSAFKWENWCSYEIGDNVKDTKSSKWANAVTDDGSYWVWIPRFKYKIIEQPITFNNAGKIDVKFISKEEKSGATVNGSTYTTNLINRTVSRGDVTVATWNEYITTDQDGYIIHPAFENGSSTSNKAQGQTDYIEYNNGEWDSELSGFWVSKYSMGSEIKDEKTYLISKPNVSIVTKFGLDEVYSSAYNYDRAKESHLIKMSEWGAVAYLTHSQYGRNGNDVTMNNSLSRITGMADIGENRSAEYNTKNGMNASSTGNIYGIYDFNQGMGNVSYTAAWQTGVTRWANGILVNGISVKVPEFVNDEGKSSKYATAYTYNASMLCVKTGDGFSDISGMDYYSLCGWRNTELSKTYDYDICGALARQRVFGITATLGIPRDVLADTKVVMCQ